jgi:hypothetical protein
MDAAPQCVWLHKRTTRQQPGFVQQSHEKPVRFIVRAFFFQNDVLLLNLIW